MNYPLDIVDKRFRYHISTNGCPSRLKYLIEKIEATLICESMTCCYQTTEPNQKVDRRQVRRPAKRRLGLTPVALSTILAPFWAILAAFPTALAALFIVPMLSGSSAVSSSN
uniref:Uncharacterized protein n=1 Tax=Romanomermis culicivorax TaxID=13658 RepID=A0A915K4Z5_ROMCU